MHNIILASTSPRRKTLLQESGLLFEVVASSYEENMALDMPPKELAKYLASKKALDVAKKYTNHIIIAADTFIVHDQILLGKPLVKEKAIATLKRISDNIVSVVSGVIVLDSSCMKKHIFSVETIVYIKKLTDEEICSYVATGESLDCAGAFNIFGKGQFIIQKIDGSYTNSMGLPMKELENVLMHYNISLTKDTEKWLQKKLKIES